MIIHRYAKGNNAQMGSNYEPTQPLAYKTSYDAINLHVHSMSQALLFRDFRWLDEREWSHLDWTCSYF